VSLEADKGIERGLFMRVDFCFEVFSRKRYVCAVSESRENSVPFDVRIIRLRASFDMGGDS
jgi:hypothetical protein